MKNIKLIVIEGPQGTGKTTLANYLRENIPGSNLYRLSGQKDKSKTGKSLSQKMYEALMDYLEKMQDIPMDLIFDRTFFTEEIYARLGYKDYSFTDVYEKLMTRFNDLDFDIYYICLYLKDTNLYIKRLERESHHNYQAFNLDNSVNQQNKYLELCEEIESKYKNIKVLKLAMDDFKESYEKVKELFAINNK